MSRYLASGLSSSNVAAWKSAAPDSSFHLPSPNPFVPTNFDVLPPPPSSVASNSTPQLIKNSDADAERVWWLQDVMFRVCAMLCAESRLVVRPVLTQHVANAWFQAPKIVMKVRMTNDVMYATAANAVRVRCGVVPTGAPGAAVVTT